MLLTTTLTMSSANLGPLSHLLGLLLGPLLAAAVLNLQNLDTHGVLSHDSPPEVHAQSARSPLVVRAELSLNSTSSSVYCYS